MARSLNKVELIGNLTRDPELRYTPQGTAVCSFGLATNRQWTTDAGEKKEDVEFHRIVSWNKLAELCAQLLSKGRKVYVEGRLQTRRWTTQEGIDRTTTEIVINEMIILDSRFAAASRDKDFDIPDKVEEKTQEKKTKKEGAKKKVKTKKKDTSKGSKAKGDSKKSVKKVKGDDADEDSQDEDIPF